VGVKWPNDVVVDGRKICGILSEGSSEGGRMRFVVVGVGMNVNIKPNAFPAEISSNATSCESVTGRALDRKDVLARILASLESTYDEFVRDGFGAMVGRFKSRMTLLGQTVTYAARGSTSVGRVVDLAVDGGLVVEDETGNTTLLYDEDVSIGP
jgi:BirA family biotin operon repressor/biotin-[acetyl-CoA-carboxylase] ligase